MAYIFINILDCLMVLIVIVFGKYVMHAMLEPWSLKFYLLYPVNVDADDMHVVNCTKEPASILIQVLCSKTWTAFHKKIVCTLKFAARYMEVMEIFIQEGA